MKLVSAFKDGMRTLRLLEERAADNAVCTAQMREYAETVCYGPRPYEPIASPLTDILARAVR